MNNNEKALNIAIAILLVANLLLLWFTCFVVAFLLF